jgi:SAM-dependent methyltransferase
MVELARARGVNVVIGDVQALQFPEGTFDCVLAAWMLYHVAGLDLGLREIARVLRDRGRLVVVLNGREHLTELRQMLNVGQPEHFAVEDAPSQLSKHLSNVEVRDASGWIVFPTRRDVEDYVRASRSLVSKIDQLPAFETPLRVRRAVAVVIGIKGVARRSPGALQAQDSGAKSGPASPGHDDFAPSGFDSSGR